MSVHHAASSATSTLEATSRLQIREAFAEWSRGDLTDVTVRYRLEAIVRQSYRSSAAVARQVAVDTGDLIGWKPEEVFNTEYLQDLLSDIRRNLRDVKSGALTESQAISRMEHGAGVASQRGYTDQMISAYSELEVFGLRVTKYWIANFKNNSPCPSCRQLHGTSVPLKSSFRGTTGIYRDLLGPPRHPRCQCKLFIFVTSLETPFTAPDFETPQDSPQMMSTQDVKEMSPGIFQTVKATLSAIVRIFRRK